MKWFLVFTMSNNLFASSRAPFNVYFQFNRTLCQNMSDDLNDKVSSGTFYISLVIVPPTDSSNFKRTLIYSYNPASGKIKFLNATQYNGSSYCASFNNRCIENILFGKVRG